MLYRKNSQLPLGLTYEDLPAWMRKTRREVDWAFLGVAVLCVVVIWPFMARSGIPYNSGMQMEVSRTVEMAEGIQSGVLYPRWAADFNYGYGSPLWNYLAPLPHYLTALHYVLIQSSPETSVKVIFMLSVALCGLGMFSFVRRRWGMFAGLLAAAAYLYSPQVVLVQPYLESDLAGTLAMGLFVMALWAFDRVLVAGRGWDVSVAALVLAGLLLAHAPLSMILAGIVLGWLVWRAVVNRVYSAWAFVAFGLGVALAGFYWIPAWLEWSDVRWLAASTVPLEDWHPLRLLDMLALPGLLDRSAVNPVPTHSLGIMVWGGASIALLALLVWLWHRTPPDPRPVPRGEALQYRLVLMLRTVPAAQRDIGYFVLIGGVTFVLVTPVGAVLWERLRGWPALYPRDMLPLIAACGAMVAGQIGHLLERGHRPLRALAGMWGILGMVALLALPTLPLPAWTGAHSVNDVSSLLREETRGYMAASQVTGWLLPRAVPEVPQPAPALIASYESGLVDTVDRNALPRSVQVDIIGHTPQSERLIVQTESPVILTLLTFDYPGWQVQVDNVSIPVWSEVGTGLITFEVQAGRHEVLVRFGSTPARNAGWVISGLALAAVVTLGSWLESRQSHRRHTVLVSMSDMASWQHVMLLFAVLVFSIGGAVPRLAPELFTRRSLSDSVEPAQHQLPRTLQGGVDLLAYDVEPGASVHPGSHVTITLYWRASRPDLPDYQTELAIVSANDSSRRVSFAQHRQPGMIPSSQWPKWALLDRYIRDTYYLEIDKNALEGEYNIIVQAGRCGQVNLFPCETIEPLFVRDGRGSSLGQHIVLPTVIKVQP
ncbi:MAG: hypothetical protein JXQ72_05740 [Anaerolineae bacterium]|nr:hypothetical protein [Anaerolineae bacterium]